MANIQLKIVGLGDFSSVTTQLKALQTQISNINKEIAGVGLSSNLRKQLNDIQNEFKSTMLSSGQFTAQQVKLTSETEKFGQALQAGKLKLGDYFNIITKRSADAQKSVQALATEQVKLNNSIVQQDITKSGVYNVYTPTKINELSKATEIAAAKQNIFNLAIREGSNQLINFGKNTQWAGRQLTVGLSMPVLLFGSQAMKTFQDVNDELVRMQKVYGTGLTQPTQAALDTIKTQVTGLGKELASSMGIAVKDTAAMAADLAATGKTGNDLIVATREAMRLSKLGELDTQSAMKATISLQNVYKLSTQDLSGAVNFLNAVENQTSTSLQDLVDGIPRVGPIVQQLGGSFKDTAVMMVAMKEAGVPAAQSANAIKSAIASLINPTKAAKDAFAGYNINLANIASSTKGNPVQMIMQLQSALKGLAPLAQAQLIEKLFGKFQEARIQALITNLGAVNSQTKTAFDLVNATAPQLAAVAASEMKIATESTTGKFKRAVETLKADLIPVGQKIMEVATSIMNFGAKIASFFNGLPGPIKNGLGILLTLGAIAGPIIMVTGLFANLMGQVIKVGYSLWGLVDGSKKWKDLMTPAAIAGKHMTDVMNVGLLENVTAVDTLNASLARLVASLEAVSSAMTLGTAGVATKVEGLLLPGMPGFGKKMASGGIVPGSGNTDSFPAMLMPGEAVIPKTATQKYSPFINAMISGNLPGYAYGLTPEGEAVGVQRGHVLSPHDQATLDAMNSPANIAAQNGRLRSVNAVTRGGMMAMPTELNQMTRSGASGASAADVVSSFRRVESTGINPMGDFQHLAGKLGADMPASANKLKQAYDEMIIKLEEMGNSGKKIFGTGKGQQSLESWMEEQLRPTLQQIKTKVGSNLDAVTQNIIGTRGEQVLKGGKVKTGSTGQVYYREADGSVVPLTQSSVGSYIGKSDVHTTGRAVKGSRSGSANDYNAARASGAALGNAVDDGFRSNEGIDAHSNSRKGIKAAKDYTGGVKQGLAEGEAGIKTQADKLSNTVDNSVRGRFNRAFSPTSRMGGMMGKLSGMGTMGRMGLGMGAGMAVQMASPLLQKMPGGSEISGALSGASMGMTFGPWGAAAGAAIGLVSSSITHLMASEKQHAASVKASFTASADVITMFGGSMVDQTPKIHTFAKELDLTAKAASQVENNVNAISKMDSKTSSLKQVSDLLKGQNTASSVIGTAEQFAAAQVANGMDPAKVTEMITAMLTYAGKTEYLNAALKEINKNTKDSTTATETWISKLKNASGPIDITAKSYSDLNSKQKLFASGALEVANRILDSTTSWTTAISLAQGLSTAIGNATQEYNLLIIAAGNANDTQLIKNLQASQSAGLDPAIALIKAKVEQRTAIKAIKDPLKQEQAIIKAVNEQINADNQAAITKNAAAMKKYQSDVAAAEAAAAPITKDKLQKAKDELKTLQDKLKVQQQNTAELQKQQQFQLSQSDLENQIRLAQASGDYLKASLLQQQKASNTADYASGNELSDLQKLVDSKQAQVDVLQAEKDKTTTVAAAGAGVTKPTLANGGLSPTMTPVQVNDQMTKLTAALDALTKQIILINGQNNASGGVDYNQVNSDINNSSIGLKIGNWLGMGNKVYNGKTGQLTSQAIGDIITKNGYKVGDKFSYPDPTKPGYLTQYQVTQLSGNMGNADPRAKYLGDIKDLKKKATGGPVSGNTPYMVGEKGPEIFTPGQSGGIIPNMNIGKYVGGFVSWLSKTALETVGVSPAMRLAQGKKQTNWDYLGAATMALGGLKGAALLPKVLKPLFAVAESTDLTQNAAEAASGLKGGTSSTSNAHHTYNINVSAGSNASADDIAKVVLNTIQRNQNMVSSNRAVRP